MESLERALKGKRPIICIAGPTASGKTAMAIRVAQAVDGEIVNADALQVYADLQILSARPDAEELSIVPHHLFGHVTGDQIYSTGEWVREVVPTLREILSRGKVPILAGGTGLYFNALLQGLADIPPVSKTIEGALNTLPIDALRAEATRVDRIAAARVLGDDPQRLQRIVGVYRETGKPLSDWQAETHPILPKKATQRAVLMPDREMLYDRINLRFDHMLGAGAMEEAQTVHAMNLPSRSPMLKAIGLSHLLSYLDGECDLETAIDTAKRDSRRLAKRQMTWFRNRCADWTVLVTEEDKDQFLSNLQT